MSKNFEKEYKESISRAKKILGNCDEPIDTNVKEAIEAIFPILKDKTDEQKWKILKSMIHSNVPDNIYSYYKLGRGDFESWLDDKSKEILVLKDQIESLTAALKLFNESKHKPVVSREVIKDGIAHFGITQHQIDNWLKKYFNIIDQDPCEDCKHTMLNCHNFPCMEKIAFSKGKTIYEVAKPEQLNEQEKVNCDAGPMFREGDWITNGKLLTGQVISFDGEYYHYMRNGVEQPLHVSNAHNWYLWTIQDAKDGDVLITVDDKRPFIYKGCLDPNHPDSPVAYCGIDSEGYFICSCVDEFNHWWTEEKVQPATKEQRDLLFQKMKEAEYEWNADVKKLNKVEQKPDWSEEDEKMVNDIIAAIDTLHYHGMVNWLKTLKDRVQPQSKQEWSEEDENRFLNLISLVKFSSENEATKKGFIGFINKFKSLRPQSQWKPNEEQLIALNNAVLLNEDHYNGAVLSTLLEQLKKL